MKMSKFIVLSFIAVLFGSCARQTGIRVTTNTFANKDEIPLGFEPDSSFSIATKQKGDSLFSKEVSQKIATLLKDRGFTVKTGDETHDANYAVTFAFGMKESTHVRDVPVFVPDYGPWYYHSWPYGYGYDYGYTVAYVPEEYTLFNKILLVEVYKNGGSDTEGKTPIWQGMTDCYEEDSDLRDAIDYLLVTVFKHFGQNTKRYIKSTIQENDAEVEKLRQDYFEPVGFLKEK